MRYVMLHDDILRPSPEITVDENNVVQTENQDAVKFSRSQRGYHTSKARDNEQLIITSRNGGTSSARASALVR